MLTKQSLTRQAFDALVQKIVVDDLRPGDSLPSTAELIEEFGISRPVVREALSALQACGFVELRNGRAPIVTELDGALIQMFIARASHLQADPMSKLMEVRLALETQSARLAARRADAAELQRIAQLNDRMTSQLQDSDVYPTLDAEFHAEIATAADNQVLRWMIHSIRTELMTVMHAVRAHRDQQHLVGREQEQHEAIFQAIRDGDEDRAARAMRDHLISSLDLVREVEATTSRTLRAPTVPSAPAA